jgi:two-component system, OmpR family, sensor histidine kinase KdpD
MSSSSLNSPHQQAAASGPARGKLKIYLGYAAGVGKTYQMLEEAHDLVRNGIDLVVGYFEPHDRPDTTVLLEGLEMVPCRRIEYRGIYFTEMDPDAVVRRHPQIALVDEFPHSNVPNVERAKRWEDVLYLLENGIDVWTTMNVQHLESLNDDVYKVSGVRIRETIPDWVVQQASEVVMVDLAPRALLNRLDRGVIYRGEKAESAKKNFFTESTLVALREFALRETAFEVESRHSPSEGAGSGSEPARTLPIAFNPPSPMERVLVLLTPDPSTAALVRRGKRVADYLKAECIAVVICRKGDLSLLPAAERTAMEKHLKFARNLHVRTHILPGDNVARELAAFAHQNGITQIYLSRQKRAWGLPFRRGLIHQITRLAGDLEITIVAERGR